ncbi:MAG: helix-turn-helix domain-containing protein [Candidatus Margulisbacteria bacterium]|jgi:transcriptional regulator with XRE-family HTH domain|nr:helix-turn-helix domain-containing protein [Candidatus Margulisiibacteriota bacterium]
MDNEISDDDLKKLFSEKLSLLRKNSGHTMEAIADSLDLDKSEYFRFLKGLRLPHLRTLLRISRKYGVTLDWWFKELDDLPRDKNSMRQKTFELQALSALRKFRPEKRPGVLAALKILARTFQQDARGF